MKNPKEHSFRLAEPPSHRGWSPSYAVDGLAASIWLIESLFLHFGFCSWCAVLHDSLAASVSRPFQAQMEQGLVAKALRRVFGRICLAHTHRRLRLGRDGLYFHALVALVSRRV